MLEGMYHFNITMIYEEFHIIFLNSFALLNYRTTLNFKQELLLESFLAFAKIIIL